MGPVLWLSAALSLVASGKVLALPQDEVSTIKQTIATDDLSPTSVVENSTSTTEDDYCNCVPFYLCDESQIWNSTGSSHQEKNCTNEFEVCCMYVSDPNTSKLKPESTTAVALDKPQTVVAENATSRPHADDCVCVSAYDCQDDVPDTRDPDYGLKPQCEGFLQICCKSVYKPVPKPEVPMASQLQPYLGSCGHRKPLTNHGSASNNIAEFGELPWMTALLQFSPEGKKNYLCGGSLIHPQVVLTGAHCVFGKKNLLIRAGEWDTSSTAETFPHQERNVTKVVIHEKYGNTTLYNDVALLVLESPVEIKAAEGHVGLICLPEADEEFSGRNCVASGWGKTSFGKKDVVFPIFLKKVNLPVVPRDVCQEGLRKTRLGSKFTLHSSFICAGGEPGIDTCVGDGGGPLVCPSKTDPGRMVQAGIVAWGIGCGSNTPGVYGNVAAFVPWIHSQLQQHLPTS